MSAARPDKTRFLSALRPFSLVVALAGCGLAASLAWQDGYRTPLPIALVMLAGLLLQAAVNLVNDHGDLHRPGFDAAQRRRIRRNARIGWLLFALVMVIGLYLVSLRGWPLALLGLVGLAGAWGYAAPPLDYKSRGLGVPLVFLFMGVLLFALSIYAAFRMTQRAAVPLEDTGTMSPVTPILTPLGLEYAQEVAIEADQEGQESSNPA